MGYCLTPTTCISFPKWYTFIYISDFLWMIVSPHFSLLSSEGPTSHRHAIRLGRDKGRGASVGFPLPALTPPCELLNSALLLCNCHPSLWTLACVLIIDKTAHTLPRLCAPMQLHPVTRQSTSASSWNPTSYGPNPLDWDLRFVFCQLESPDLADISTHCQLLLLSRTATFICIRVWLSKYIYNNGRQFSPISYFPMLPMAFCYRLWSSWSRNINWDQRDDSAVKGICCSCTRPEFGAQHPHQEFHRHQWL